MTVAINDDARKASDELDGYLANYYNLPAERIRAEQYCFAGEAGAVAAWINRFVEGGASHLCVRVTGSDDEAQMESLARLREAWA